MTSSIPRREDTVHAIRQKSPYVMQGTLDKLIVQKYNNRSNLIFHTIQTKGWGPWSHTTTTDLKSIKVILCHSWQSFLICSVHRDRVQTIGSYRPFPSYLVPLFQNEFTCSNFKIIMCLIYDLHEHEIVGWIGFDMNGFAWRPVVLTQTRRANGKLGESLSWYDRTKN